MCGIAGTLDALRRSGADAMRAQVLHMADALAHRGPDDRGAWVDPEAGIALGHRRLSILDLSAEGAQPMVSHCGRFVLSYNGEVYDHGELREQLETLGHHFRGHSDTEVLVEAISRWGVEPTLRRVNGMFAFAVWDAAERTLSLARDRLGKKPMYYGWCGQRFFFASELKALRAHPDFHADIDRDALGLLVRYSYIPAPWSILRGVRKLEAGHSITLRGGEGPHELSPRGFWSPRELAEAGLRDPFDGSPEEASAELESLLLDAVDRRMVADVEVGALLSGGFDSSSVVALMQAQSSRPIRTFSIGYREGRFDEAGHARAVSKYLGTEHRELMVTPADALEVIPELPGVFDEPFADASQIPTLLVSRLAREDVTVALSGDGGDELFAGYNRYFSSISRWERYSRAPRGARRLAARWLSGLARSNHPPAGPASDVVPAWRRVLGLVELESDLLDAMDPVEIFARKSARCPLASRFVRGASDPPTAFDDRQRWAALPEPIEQMMFLDCCLFLPEDVLTKVDRASMATSLEVRAPLLDHRVVEFAWRLPLSLKVVGRERKWPLRRVLDRYVPRTLTDRPKSGFGIPIAGWLRGPLRDWAEALLDEGRLRREGYFHPTPVRAAWTQHQTHWRSWHTLLWGILMFQAWLEEV